jgi:hypothetical protein
MPNYNGQACRSGDTDPLKCMVCVIAWEGITSSQVGMEAVGETVMRRLDTKGYGNTICQIVYAPGQYVGLKSGKVLNFGTATAKITLAAYNAIEHGPSLYTDYRSCPNAGTDIGGNCFRRATTSMDRTISGQSILEVDFKTTPVATTASNAVPSSIKAAPTGDDEAKAAVANLVPPTLKAN